MGRARTENEMGERPRDDTTDPAPESQPARGRGGYYYDDATGYEVYRPEEDEEEAGGGGRNEVATESHDEEGSTETKRAGAGPAFLT
jgi:hypothetical protein